MKYVQPSGSDEKIGGETLCGKYYLVVNHMHLDSFFSARLKNHRLDICDCGEGHAHKQVHMTKHKLQKVSAYRLGQFQLVLYRE